MARIGFVGLGNMGGPMARNLLKAGHQVAGFDLAPAALAPVVAAGATAAASAAAAAEGAEFVITMLPAGKHVRDAWTGSHGMAAASDEQATVLRREYRRAQIDARDRSARALARAVLFLGDDDGGAAVAL